MQSILEWEYVYLNICYMQLILINNWVSNIAKYFPKIKTLANSNWAWNLRGHCASKWTWRKL